MKILMMTNTYTPVVGGVEESIKTFTKQLKKRGHKVLIVVPEFPNMPVNEEDVIRIPAIQRFNGSDFSVNLPIPGLLAKLMKDFSPDIVHSHHPFLIGDMALRLCGQYEVPLIFTNHTRFEEYVHYLPFHGEAIKRFVVELSSGYADLADYIIAPTKSVYDILRERNVRTPIKIIPTGIDMERFSHFNREKIRDRFNIPKDAFVVGHLGRLTLEKNIGFLARAVADFLEKESSAHFLVVGKGPLEIAIKQICEQKGVVSRLHLAGLLEAQDVIDSYHAMDVFAFASYTETQGLVLEEALASGVPVVAIDASGVRDIIEDGKNGRMILRQNQEDFVDALRWYFSQSFEAKQKMKDAAKKSVEHFSVKECTDKLLEVYESARGEKTSFSDEEHSIWRQGLHRIKTEWEMVKNITEASSAAFNEFGENSVEKRKAHRASVGERHEKGVRLRLKRLFTRHEWSAHLLGLSKSKSTEVHPGLVMIQIDGFSKAQLMRALKEDRMPFLKSLIEKQYYKCSSFYTGLPSSTPSVQGELFYGIRQGVPAFAFWNDKRKRIARMYDGIEAVDVEKRLSDQQKALEGEDAVGLLHGGSSYSNVFSGGASEAHFCAASLGWHQMWKGIKPIKMVVLIATHLFDFIRIIFLMSFEAVLAIIDFIKGMFKGENFQKELKFILTRSLICVLLRELISIGVRIDMARGLPIIHMNFLGYDEQAHRRGPSSKFAHWALKGIDKTIEGIYKEALHSTRRSYDVWIYSDHGQEDVMSYPVKYGKMVQDAIAEVFEELNLTVPILSEHDHRGMQSQRLRYLGDWSFLRRLLLDSSDNNHVNQERLVVTAIGPTGNIYLPRKLSREERDKFARKLVSEAKIPVVLVPEEEGKVRFWTDKGEFMLPEDAEVILGEDHSYIDDLTKDLISVCHHPDAGAYTFGGWLNGKKPMSFPIEGGAHAGPGTEETNSFILLPSEIVSSLGESEYLYMRDLRKAALHLLEREVPERSQWSVALKKERKRDSFHERVVRIMTYNVHSCIGLDGKISYERIARVISRHEPDIVALQELDLRKERTGSLDQTHLIAQQLEMMYYFHPNIRIEEEHYGNAVLSRFPMRLVRAGRLPGIAHRNNLEPRGAIWCSIDAGGTQLQFFNTHLGLNKKERLNQVGELFGSDWLKHNDCKGEVVLCGDFNASPKSEECRLIREVLFDAQLELEGHKPHATWFGPMPIGRIDHVFVSSQIKIRRVEVSKTDLDKKASDHLPLIVDISLSQ